MKTYISTLSINSGVPNPVANISENTLESFIKDMNFEPIDQPLTTPDEYNGLTISDLNNDAYYAFFIEFQNGTNTVTLIDYTLGSNVWQSSTNIVDYVREIKLLFNIDIQLASIVEKSCLDIGEPEIVPPYHLESGYWNWTPAYINNFNITRENNCYNYAVSLRTNTFAQVGRASGYGINLLSRNAFDDSIFNGARADGLTFPAVINEIDIVSSFSNLVALITAETNTGFDFHWAKLSYDDLLNPNAFIWSHKAGQTNATSLGAEFQNFSDFNQELTAALPTLRGYRNTRIVAYLLADARYINIT